MNRDVLKDMLIGGNAGIVSRTLTAPIELYKVQRQNQYLKDANFRSVLQKEGIRYLWKGNLTNCLRVFPQYAINFAVFENVKHSVFKNVKDETFKNFYSGGISGVTAMTLMYPLETIRTRLSLQMNKSHYKGPFNAIKKMSFRSLYGGLGISLIGFGPFNALNFMFFYKYKELLENREVEGKLVKFLAGGLGGISALTITYPTDLLRKHYQMSGFNSDVPKYNGILDGFVTIAKNEGIRGLYKGLLPSYIRIFPCLGIQFWCLEKGKELLK
jgi:solute carrier family 25 phosphate transporter 23/24/25/41